MALKTAKNKAKAAGAEARYAIRPAAESAVDMLGSALADTRDRVVPAVSDLASDARDRLGPALDDARKKVGPALDEARKKVGPAVDDARKKVGPALDDARERVAPVASQALEQSRHHGSRLAQMAAEQGRTHGRKAAVRIGLVEEPKSHKLRNVLLVLIGLAGIAAIAAKKFLGGDKDEAWTMGRDTAAAGGSHRSAATPAPAQAPPADSVHDVGGGELDESLATDEGAAARHAAALGGSAAAPGVDDGSSLTADEPVVVVPSPAESTDLGAGTATSEAGSGEDEPPSNTTPVDPPTAEQVAESNSSGKTAKSASRKKKS